MGAAGGGAAAAAAKLTKAKAPAPKTEAAGRCVASAGAVADADAAKMFEASRASTRTSVALSSAMDLRMSPRATNRAMVTMTMVRLLLLSTDCAAASWIWHSWGAEAGLHG